MAPTPHRIAQTSTEAKKQHKKSGAGLPERQHKQLERAHELDQRAARLREAEQRRKAARKKREEREAKEALARKQMGVGIATQLIGYSHTQARLKSGMEAFLGVKQRKEEERRKKELELTRKLEEIAEKIEKEPWDDDEEDDIALDLPEINVSVAEQWLDNDLDDDSLLEAHDLVMSDPIEERAHKVEPSPASAPPVLPTPPKKYPIKESPDFVRLHGPINKVIEAALDKLPEDLIELLSQDISLNIPTWDPPLGLLHKLNPVGLPAHRLRIKVGCHVTVLKDLNTSSQLSKSQHLRILRADNDRLECLVLDGQLEGTKTFLTRIPFHAKYKNLDEYPFQRTQFPIRIATDYVPSCLPRDTSQSGFKLPSVPNHVRPTNLPKRTSSTVKSANPGFKLPGLPASKSNAFIPSKPPQPVKAPLPPFVPPMDGWDDFLESGTQIARELASETTPAKKPSLKEATVTSLSATDSFPPLSTQDLDFSLEDLDDEITPKPSVMTISKTLNNSEQPNASNDTIKAAPKSRQQFVDGTAVKPQTKPAVPQLARKLLNTATKPNHSTGKHTASELVLQRPFPKPPSVSDRPGLKRKGWKPPAHNIPPPPKRPCMPVSCLPPPVKLPTAIPTSLGDFVISTQDAASFFDDDDNLSFGSPPIAA